MDIIYVPMAKDFLYLTAVLDWHARYVLDVGFCLQVLVDALRHVPAPHIFKSDQGSRSSASPTNGLC